MVRDFLTMGDSPMPQAFDIWIAAARCAVDENFSAPANHGPSVHATYARDI